MNKPLNKTNKKQNKKLILSPSKKTVIKRPNLNKRALEARLLSETINGVVLLTDEEVFVLKIRLDSKGAGSILINSVLFSCEKVEIANQKHVYVFKRTLDKANIKNAALISADQAAKIGLSEGIDRIKVGNSYYKVHYVDYADFPDEFKQANKIAKPLEDFYPQDESNASSKPELSKFFADLRQRRNLATSDNSAHSEADPNNQRVTVSNLKQSLIPKGDRSKQYYDIIDLKPGNTVTKKKTTIDQDLDTDLKRETELELSRPTSTAPEEFEVDFTFDQYKTVNDFWTKLFNFYNVDLNQWEKRVSHFKSQDQIQPIYDLEQEYLNTIMNSKNNPGNLLIKQDKLAKQENELSQKLATLRLVLVSNQLDPSSNEEYLGLDKEHQRIKNELAEVESRLKFLQENPQNQDYQAGRRHFIEVVGLNDVIHKNQDLVLDKSLTLDKDLNKIEDDKVLLERLLQKKLLALNEAKQTKIKLEQQRRELIAKNREFDDADVQLSNHLADLAERGRIHEKNALIQAQINRERNRLDNSIANLQEFPVYEDYEKEVKTLEQKDQELAGKKSELDEFLVTAQHKLLHERKIIAQECEASRKFFFELEKDILDLVNDFERQALFSLENVRKIWNEQVVYELNSIYNRNNNILTQVSNVVLSQIERLSVEQVRLSKVFDQERINWLKLFEETTQEFRLQGLYVPPSQVRKIKKHNQFSLADYPIGTEELKVINLEYNLEFTNEPEILAREQKKNLIIGLDPITKDDSEYQDDVILSPEEGSLPKPTATLENDQPEKDDQTYINGVGDLVVNSEIQKQENLTEENNLKELLAIEESEALILSRYLNSLRSKNIASSQNKLLEHADRLLEHKKAWFEDNDIQIDSQKPMPNPDELIPDNSLSYEMRKNFNKSNNVDPYAELIGENNSAIEKSILAEEEIFGGDNEISEKEIESQFQQTNNLTNISESNNEIPDLSGKSILFSEDEDFRPNKNVNNFRFGSKSYLKEGLEIDPKWSEDLNYALNNEKELLMQAPTSNPTSHETLIKPIRNSDVLESEDSHYQRKTEQLLRKIDDEFEKELIKARNDLENSGEKIDNLLKED